MRRRSLIAIVSASVLGLLMLLAGGGVALITQTRWGQDVVRGLVVARISPAFRGQLLIGHIDLSSFLTKITIDSVEIHDASGEPVFVSGRLETGYDYRDLFAARIALRGVVLDHPYLHLRQHANGTWNFNEIFRGKPPSPNPGGPQWLGYVVLDTVRVHNATFVLSLPWQPDDTLHGAALDSNIAHELLRTDHIIRRTADGFERTYSWSNATASLPHMRLFDPDSDKKAGKYIRIDDLRVDESDPPFLFRHMAGVVQIVNDSLHLALTHFELPASSGSAIGKIEWPDNLPVRYEIAIRADSIALNDVNWVYPNLPRQGGGTTLVRISNARNSRELDVQLDSMNMRSTGSHLTGSMTFGTGEPILAIRDLNVVADPIDFNFIRALNGKAFPVDWQGQLFGTVKGQGGPLDNFVVDDVTGEWHDGHVQGAVTRVSGRGDLDITNPGDPVFRDFQVNVGLLDLRSIEFLYPSFPRLGGTISGVATLDSSLFDVRFHDAGISHQDGEGDPSRFTGQGRVTSGEPVITYDLTLDAKPLSLTMMARSYPAMPFRGTVSGSIRASGQLTNLALTTFLTGASGAFSFDGQADVDSASGYGATGHGEFAGLDLAKLTAGRVPIPVLASGEYHSGLKMKGSTLAGLTGTFDADLEPSVIDSTRLTGGHADMRFADGVVHLDDSLRLVGPAGALSAAGAIGLPGAVGRSDSLTVVLVTDSLRLWRPYLPAKAGSLLDSLAAHVAVDAVLTGRMDAFDLGGALTATSVAFGATTARQLTASFAVDDPLHVPHGEVVVSGAAVHTSFYDYDSLEARIALHDLTSFGFSLGLTGGTGPHVQSWGGWRSAEGTSTLELDSGSVTAGGRSPWRLMQPASVVFGDRQIRVDSLLLQNGSGGIFSLAGTVPDSSAVDFRMWARDVPLRELEELSQSDTTANGTVGLTARITGTRARPEITDTASIRNLAYSELSLDSAAGSGVYQNDRIEHVISIFKDSIRAGAAAASASLSLPVQLSLFDYHVLLDSAVSGSIQGTGIDLKLAQMLAGKSIRSVTGTIATDAVRLSGTLRKPRLTGSVALVNASMQIVPLGIVRPDSMNASVLFFDDSIHIASFRAHSGAGHGAHTASLQGGITLQQDRTGWTQLIEPASFNLKFTATDFAAYNSPTVAQLNIETAPGDAILLTGPLDAAKLTGLLTVRNSAIYLPDPKAAGRALTAQTDTLALGGSGEPLWLNRLFAGIQLTDARVALGDNVALKSLLNDPTKVEVGLSGTLNVRGAPSASADFYGLALEGTLNAAQGGKYNLYLGGFIQRPFKIVSSGTMLSTIQFNGQSGNNPILDLHASTDITSFGRPTITIIANVSGPLRPQPSLSFSSPDLGAGLAQSDYLSYILIGKPGFDFADSPGVVELLTTVLGPSVNSFAGGFLGSVTFTGANTDLTQNFQNQGAQHNSFTNYILGSRAATELQLPAHIALSVSASPFCAALNGGGTGGAGGSFLSQLGLSGKADWRVLGNYTRLQASVDASTQALQCSQSGTSLPGLAPTPYQYGLSILHTWRW